MTHSTPRQTIGEEEAVPDVLGEITAFKYLYLNSSKQGLHSSVGNAYWEKEGLTAKCDPNKSKNHIAPLENCSCGIYCLSDMEMLVHDHGNNYWHQILVELAVSGKVIQHKRGYRAQHARIVKIYVNLKQGHLIQTLEEVANKLECEVVSSDGGPLKDIMIKAQIDSLSRQVAGLKNRILNYPNDLHTPKQLAGVERKRKLLADSIGYKQSEMPKSQEVLLLEEKKKRIQGQIDTAQKKLAQIQLKIDGYVID